MDKNHYAEITASERPLKVQKDEHILFEGAPIMNLVEFYKGQKLPEVLYFSKDGMNMNLFHKNSHKTTCPIKGEASYWDLKIDGEHIENAVWSYEDPLPEATEIKGYFGFDRKKTRVKFVKT